ncbi:hypothetical protein V7079_19575 [Priestia megaterium]|uniref:hypothetical protein n=1 Tax=Priestia megaterium TaxID=1404 RepID=UPI00145FCDFC|nr:hypothetical protein [Priestia megaterium]
MSSLQESSEARNKKAVELFSLIRKEKDTEKIKKYLDELEEHLELEDSQTEQTK